MLQTDQPKLPRPTDPVEQPIINSPFHPPQYYWDLDTSAKALDHVLDGRRPSQDIPPVAGSKKIQGRIGLPGQFGAVWEPLELVNDIRERVLEWQEAGYPGVTPTTRGLIDHWTNPEACQLYFAQLDAVLTHIYLHEVAPPEIREKLHDIDRKYNEGIHRIAHKMATATGKTPLMAMLILYHTANQNAAPDDQRFVRRFLVITPGLTVKERLHDSLNPGHEDNDWTAFSLAPLGDRWERALTFTSINIINYHQMEPKQVVSIGTKQQNLIDGGSTPTTEAEMEARTETTADVIERIADGKSQKGRILVINDEGHHCHRGDPDNKKHQKETEWFDGIRRIQGQNLLHYVTDMSATPIFLTQSSPRPFDWIVSDYSLVDAIEAGLTKIPRVPTHTSLRDEAEFRDIFGSTDSKQTSNFQPETIGNNPVLKRALRALCDDYAKIHSEKSARPIGEQPVIAIVMNSVKNANAMYRYIAGGSVSPLLGNFSNPLKTQLAPDPHTIIVHSKLEDGEEATGETATHIRALAEVYRSNPKYGFSGSDKPGQIIRRVMNTVGRYGQPGENVRCVISVDMLTEGWNTKNVTHLLGFRRFGSSLLCEQVAGRTLRRITRTREPDNVRFKPEYAMILGIPFPKYEEAKNKDKSEGPTFPLVTVEVDSDRTHLRVEWPNIVQLQRVGGRQAIEVQPKPAGPDEDHEVPEHNTEIVYVEPTVGRTVRLRGGEPISASRFAYMTAATVARHIEQETLEQTLRDPDDSTTIQLGKLFSQIVQVAELYQADGTLCGPSDKDKWPSNEEIINSASEWLHRNVEIIKPDANGILMEAVPSAIAPWQHTGLLREYEIEKNPDLVYGPTIKSEITYAHCDSHWEVELAERLDEMPEVTRWARNKVLNWSIPYVVERQPKRYWPDFIAVVPIRDGLELNIVIETKGLVHEYDPVKRRWAQEYWVPAVNRHPEYGVAADKRWAYLYLDNHDLVLNAREKILEAIEQAKGE